MRDVKTCGFALAELLCAIVIVGVLGAILTALTLAATRRAAALDEVDTANRRSERVFALIGGAVRAQREAPGIPLWSLLVSPPKDAEIPSLPSRGRRAPLPNTPLLVFAKLDSHRQWKLAQASGELESLSLCEQRLFAGRAVESASALYLGIVADGLVLLEGKVNAQQRFDSYCLSPSATGVFRTAKRFWPFALRNAPERLNPLPSADLIAIRGVEDAFALYLDGASTLRRASLITSENQPVAEGVSELRAGAVTLAGLDEMELHVELVFEPKPPTRVGAVREGVWIVPVASVGEQLIGIL